MHDPRGIEWVKPLPPMLQYQHLGTILDARNDFAKTSVSRAKAIVTASKRGHTQVPHRTNVVGRERPLSALSQEHEILIHLVIASIRSVAIDRAGRVSTITPATIGSSSSAASSSSLLLRARATDFAAVNLPYSLREKIGRPPASSRFRLLQYASERGAPHRGPT